MQTQKSSVAVGAHTDERVSVSVAWLDRLQDEHARLKAALADLLHSHGLLMDRLAVARGHAAAIEAAQTIHGSARAALAPSEGG